MDIVNYDEPPHVRYSTSSVEGSIDGASSVDSRRSQNRSVHFDQINPTFTDSSQNVDGDKKKKSDARAAVVTAHDGEPVTVKEHVIEGEKKRKVVKAPISAFAMGPWPVVNQPSDDARRTVKEKHLKLYLIFSIVAIILFFPTGIPALIFALKTKKEFYSGIERRGEVTEAAIKCSRKCEKLLILTAICILLMAVVIFAVAEKLANSGKTHTFSNAN